MPSLTPIDKKAYAELSELRQQLRDDRDLIAALIEAAAPLQRLRGPGGSRAIAQQIDALDRLFAFGDGEAKRNEAAALLLADLRTSPNT